MFHSKIPKRIKITDSESGEQEVWPFSSQIYRWAVERNEGGGMETKGRPPTNSPTVKDRGTGNWEALLLRACPPDAQCVRVAGIWLHAGFTEPQPRLGGKAGATQAKAWQV